MLLVFVLGLLGLYLLEFTVLWLRFLGFVRNYCLEFLELALIVLVNFGFKQEILLVFCSFIFDLCILLVSFQGLFVFFGFLLVFLGFFPLFLIEVLLITLFLLFLVRFGCVRTYEDYYRKH